MCQKNTSKQNLWRRFSYCIHFLAYRRRIAGWSHVICFWGYCQRSQSRPRFCVCIFVFWVLLIYCFWHPAFCTKGEKICPTLICWWSIFNPPVKVGIMQILSLEQSGGSFLQISVFAYWRFRYGHIIKCHKWCIWTGVRFEMLQTSYDVTTCQKWG